MKRIVFLAILIICIPIDPSVQGQYLLVTLQFSAPVMEVGKSAIIDVLIDCQVESCAAADLSIQFDPDALHIDNVSFGDYPNMTGNIAYLLENRIDPETGTIVLRYITFDNGYPGSTGTGTLFHIKAEPLSQSDSDMWFRQVTIASQDGETVLVPQTSIGTISVLPRKMPQTLSVQAEASSPEQITVNELDSDDTVISETVVGQSLQIELDPARNSALHLVISAPGHLVCIVTEYGDQVITLRAGDVNNDGRIDIRDATIVSAATTETELDEADLNHDNVVNVYDLILIGRNYGLSSGEC
jgi:hypothetical protein